MTRPVSIAIRSSLLMVWASAGLCACGGDQPGEGPEAEAPAAEIPASAPTHAEPGHDHGTVAGEGKKSAGALSGDTPLEELIALLKSEDEGTRESAARSIGARKGAARGALDALVAAFEDSDPNVRMAAVQAVGAMGADGAPAIEPLIALFDDPQSFTGDCGCVAFPVRIEAARALARIGEASLEPVLAQAKHAQAGRREAAMVALGEMRRADPEIVEVLTAALKDGEKRVRDKAREALLDIERAKAATPAAP